MCWITRIFYFVSDTRNITNSEWAIVFFFQYRSKSHRKTVQQDYCFGPSCETHPQGPKANSCFCTRDLARTGNNIQTQWRLQPTAHWSVSSFPFISGLLVLRLLLIIRSEHALDPAIGVRAGFGGPILHGLATFGFVARGILANIGGNNPEALKAFGARFSSPVKLGGMFFNELYLHC